VRTYERSRSERFEELDVVLGAVFLAATVVVAVTRRGEIRSPTASLRR
jgi:hypothetical protein